MFFTYGLGNSYVKWLFFLDFSWLILNWWSTARFYLEASGLNNPDISRNAVSSFNKDDVTNYNLFCIDCVPFTTSHHMCFLWNQIFKAFHDSRTLSFLRWLSGQKEWRKMILSQWQSTGSSEDKYSEVNAFLLTSLAFDKKDNQILFCYTIGSE